MAYYIQQRKRPHHASSGRLPEVNLASPDSYQHQFSPNNIHMLSREMIMRVNKMITKEKNALICYLTLSTTFLRKCMKISMENLYVDIGA